MSVIEINKFEDNYSPGCKICQKGKWLCIYLTYMCNAACPFCPAPSRNKDFVRSAFGDDPKLILDYLTSYDFEGVSFSGGESFMVFERLIQWLRFFKKHKPELYYWAYTNGINMKKEQLNILKQYGLNELRFNIAASGYHDREVLHNIALACTELENVAVEIPSIPEDNEKLISVLPELEKKGVKFLNLHEYILVPNDPNTAKSPGEEFIMNYEMKMQYHIGSLKNTERIKRFCRENNLSIKINSCTLMKKEHQMLGRRLSMGEILKKDHEKLTDDGFLETIYIHENGINNIHETLRNYYKINQTNLVHPDKYQKSGSLAFRLKILPALGIDVYPRVYQFEKII